MSGGLATAGPPIVHPRDAGRLIEPATVDVAPLTPTGTVALAIRYSFAVRKSRGFKFFGPVADKPGFATALANTIHELRASGVDPVALAALGSRGEDLAALLTEYASQLKAGNLAGIIDIFEIASEQVEAGAGELSGHPILLLDLTITSKAERRFIRALGARSAAVSTTVVGGHISMSTAITAITGDYISGSTKNLTSLDRLQNYIFSSSAPDWDYSDDGKVQFFSAPGEGRECIEIARRIQEASRAGIAFDHIAIGLRSPQNYAPLLESALERPLCVRPLNTPFITIDPRTGSGKPHFGCATRRSLTGKGIE